MGLHTFAWTFCLAFTPPWHNEARSGVWIRQYATGDWDKTHFKGQVEQVWRYDANGFALVGHVPELDRSNSITSTTPVISFCLDEAARRMIYQEWTGGRAGFGAILALSE